MIGCFYACDAADSSCTAYSIAAVIFFLCRKGGRIGSQLDGRTVGDGHITLHGLAVYVTAVGIGLPVEGIFRPRSLIIDTAARPCAWQGGYAWIFRCYRHCTRKCCDHSVSRFTEVLQSLILRSGYACQFQLPHCYGDRVCLSGTIFRRYRVDYRICEVLRRTACRIHRSQCADSDLRRKRRYVRIHSVRQIDGNGLAALIDRAVYAFDRKPCDVLIRFQLICRNDQLLCRRCQLCTACFAAHIVSAAFQSGHCAAGNRRPCAVSPQLVLHSSAYAGKAALGLSAGAVGLSRSRRCLFRNGDRLYPTCVHIGCALYTDFYTVVRCDIRSSKLHVRRAVRPAAAAVQTVLHHSGRSYQLACILTVKGEGAVRSCRRGRLCDLECAEISS